MPSIKLENNDGESINIPVLKDKIDIGRGADNDIIIQDSTVSRNHARIMHTDNNYTIMDMGSHNGIRVNGKKVKKALLRNNDLIEIGNHNLTFQTKEEYKPSDSQVIIHDEEEKDDQKIVGSSNIQEKFYKSGELLIRGARSIIPESSSDKACSEEDLVELEKSNKVLFVLYEISRQLNSLGDFNALLNEIMDLIFKIIDADYGFLILTGKDGDEEYVPVVVKYKDEDIQENVKLKASRSIMKQVIQDKVALLTSNAMKDSRLDHGESIFMQQIRSAMCVPLWKKDEIIGVIQIWSERLDNQFDQNDLQLLQTISGQMAMILEQASLNDQIREEENLRNRLERFHSPQVIDMIIKSARETKDDIMEPKDLTATVLFTDIIGFTPISEKMAPREVNMLLNQFFSRMTDIIFEYGGTLDKYIGDALMAVFGAPMEQEGDEKRAVQAALKMREELISFMKEEPAERQFKVRIGINTGRVVAGNIGSQKRMDYTVIGDAVNVASRLESIASPNQILIGESTYKAVKGKFNIKKIGAKKVKGKKTQVTVFEVLD
ncbi:adenylate/guanylate cyclase domain-containing protein [Thermodesulfobacteriota bacterium]